MHSEPDQLATGIRVRLHGLSAKQELNGAHGTLDQFHSSSGRYAVILDNGRSVLARPINFVRVDLRVGVFGRVIRVLRLFAQIVNPFLIVSRIKTWFAESAWKGSKKSCKEFGGDAEDADRCCPVCLDSLVQPEQTLRCKNGHRICFMCGRRLVFMSRHSPSGIKYDCPLCRVGCVVDSGHALALIKGDRKGFPSGDVGGSCNCELCKGDSDVGTSRSHGLRCCNGHATCFSRARKLTGWSEVSPTWIKYDCPVEGCGVGCVIDVEQAMALIKNTWHWKLNGQEGTRTNLDIPEYES